MGKFGGFMLSTQQIQELLTQNEGLQAQLNEANEILTLREEELVIVRGQAAITADLRSQLDMQLVEITALQNQINTQQRNATGAQIREQEMQEELIDSIQLLHGHTDLKKQYIYTAAQLDDLQEELTALKKKNTMLQKIAVQVGELESKVENLTYERDILMEKIAIMEAPVEK